MTEKKKKTGRGRPRKYKGDKKNFTIGLTAYERAQIEKRFKNVQEFIEWAYKVMIIENAVGKDKTISGK